MARMPKTRSKTVEAARKKVEKRTTRPQKKGTAKRSLAERIKQNLRDVRQELKRTVWPTRQQVVSSSAVVIIIVIVFSLFISAMDFIWVKLIKFITFRF